MYGAGPGSSGTNSDSNSGPAVAPAATGSSLQWPNSIPHRLQLSSVYDGSTSEGSAVQGGGLVRQHQALHQGPGVSPPALPGMWWRP